MAAPYSAAPPSGKEAAMAMLAGSVPLDIVQQAKFTPGAGAAMLPGALPPPGAISPPGVPVVPGAPGGSGLMQVSGPPGAVAAIGAITGGAAGRYPASRTEIRFVGPSGMKVSWYAPSQDGRSPFSAAGLEAPGRYNFTQASIYRLKLSNIPGRPGLELYPTLEVVPVNNKTASFIAHSAVPLSFTEDDFEQVTAGNYVVKVIYLPDPQHQDLAVVGADEVVSSRLDPGVDPIAEACKRGSILLVVRMGNIDLEAPNTPAMDAPSAYQPHHAMGPQMQGPGMVPGSGPMVPYNMATPSRPNMGPGGAMLPPGMSMPPTQLPPAQGMTPGALAPQQPVVPGTPVSKLPDPNMIQPTGGKK
jgi:hypothetical protein